MSLNDARGLAEKVRAFRTSAVVVSLALPVMVDPGMPLLDYYARLQGISRDEAAVMPIDLVRADGTRLSETLLTWLQRGAANQGRGLGLGEDLISFTMIYTATRIGDEVDRLGLRDSTSPIMEFLRHLRNACAHGNRWHFLGGEPQNPAVWRHLVADAAWHGGRAIYGNVGPAEYVDFLEDLAVHFELAAP